MAAYQLFLLWVIVYDVVASQQIITTLPGFDGDLPFKLETGILQGCDGDLPFKLKTRYIGMGESNDMQLFYYFIESERSPEDDPLVLWLTGGPGCSSFSGLIFQIGPSTFDYENSKVNLPKLLINPYTWTKIANIIFLDAPVGTGFSYANSWQGYTMNDTIASAQNYYFLRKWLIAHPNFLANPLYIAGDSYSGKIVAVVVQKISDGIDVGHEPRMNLKGYLLGNPFTDPTKDFNSRPKFAYLNALITHEIYKSAERNCKGDYVNVDPSNGLCKADLEIITACIGKVNIPKIYEPICSLEILKRPLQFKWDRSIMEDEEDYLDFIFLPTQSAQRRWCRKYNYFYAYNWANDKTVQGALGIREGTVKHWVNCNRSLSYTKDLSSSLDYHRNLIKKGYQVLIYSGDVDIVVPYVGTEAWIKSLNLTIGTGWQPWFVEGQVAGLYWYQFKETNYYPLTYPTVKGGGHTAPEYRPKECLAMIDRWFAYYPL